MCRMRDVLRNVLSHPVLLITIMLSALIYLLPAMSSRYGGLSAGAVQPAATLPQGVEQGLEATYRDYLANLRLMQSIVRTRGSDASVERAWKHLSESTTMLENALFADSPSERLRAIATYYEYLADQQVSGASRSCLLSNAAFFRAVANLEQPVFYDQAGRMPVVVYITSNQYALEQSLVWVGALRPDDQGLNRTSGCLEFLLWMVPLAVASVLTATTYMAAEGAPRCARRGERNVRASSSSMLSIAPRAVICGMLAGLLAAAAVTAPAAAYVYAAQGWGDLAYPVVVFHSSGNFVVTTVGMVLIQRILMLAAASACFASLTVGLRTLFGSIVPACVASAMGLALASQPSWYSRENPVRDLASLMPVSYLDPSHATGTQTSMVYFDASNTLPSLNVTTGLMVFLAATIAIPAVVLAAKKLGHVVKRWSAGDLRGPQPCWHQPYAARWFRLAAGLVKTVPSRAPGDPLAHGPPRCTYGAVQHEASGTVNVSNDAVIWFLSYILSNTGGIFRCFLMVVAPFGWGRRLMPSRAPPKQAAESRCMKGVENEAIVGPASFGYAICCVAHTSPSRVMGAVGIDWLHRRRAMRADCATGTCVSGGFNVSPGYYGAHGNGLCWSVRRRMVR